MDVVKSINKPQIYIIEKENKIENQVKYECAAYASTYVLRNLGYDVLGENEYRGFPKKLISGNVPPRGIIEYFRKKSIKTVYYKGTIESLKERVSSGVPVIVFMKVFANKKYRHYVPVVGYDEYNLYIAESLPFLANTSDTRYNRIIKNEELEQLWKSWFPFYRNTYFVVERKE
jgi:hypothetical protein